MTGTDANESTSPANERDERAETRDDDHLEDLPVGSGCTEIWEHLSRKRGDGTDDKGTDDDG